MLCEISQAYQAVRLKARGYRNVDNLITMVYLIAGKLRFETCMG